MFIKRFASRTACTLRRQSVRHNSTTSRSCEVVSSSSSRSSEEVARLVQRRVEERDAWIGPKQPDLSLVLKTMWQTGGSFSPTVPSKEELDKVFPVQNLDWQQIANPDHSLQVTWLGHSSLLVQIDGQNLLTDPVFNDRAFPVQWAGPLRYRPTPCTLQELVEKVKIDAVCISHNHYDHLCYDSVKYIATTSKDVKFVVPLGLQDWMQKHVTTDHDIRELDWHESTSIMQHADLKITSVPMKHWSNRIGDRDKTLWCGYVMETKSNRFLFPGDTAWFDGLEDVGKQYGPFDLAAIPIGAYEPRDFMASNHINVEEAVQMKEAVRAKKAVPIHWGTFPLTTEPVMEPREKLLELMGDDDSFRPWLTGETVHS